MPKLPPDHKFWDLSDYARPGAILLVRILLPTRIGAITLTWLFTIVGLISVILIFNRYALALAGGLLILKSLLDAADGEMARARNCPSHTGRYLDSINDLLLNGLLLFAIGIPLTVPVWEILLTWFSFQLQGTIFNYFYVVKRHQAWRYNKSNIRILASCPLSSGKPCSFICTSQDIYYILWMARLDNQ